MAVICRAVVALFVSLFAPTVIGRNLMAASDVDFSTPMVAESDEPEIQAFSSDGTPRYLHAHCAVFLDNSTIFTAQTDNTTVLYRGMTATVINYASKNVSVPWNFSMSSNPPGYSGIEQAFNFVNSTISDGIVSGIATESSLTLLPKAANNITIGLLLQANATTFPVPQSFLLNNNSCSVVILPNDVPPPANLTSPALQEVQSEAGLGLTTLNGQIIDRTSGEPISLRGFNYFGFDNTQTCVDGLWAGSTALSHDLATIIRTQQALGFNAVRLLTSFGVVFGLPPMPQSRACAAVSPADYQAYLTDPATPVTEGATIPDLAFTPPVTEGICSDYLDGFSSTFDRYIFVISLFARNGFYVVLDNQLNDDPTLINDGQDAWLGYWRQIATAVAADEASVNKVIIDGLNEPDSYGIRWEPSATRPGYGALLLALMDALYPILPGALFFVEGVDQECNGAPSSNWGDGFASQPEVLDLFPSCGISNPGPVFFEPLLSRPYLSQVVISPHVYGPSISMTTNDASGTALWTRLSQSFGYLNLAGYGGHVFPIAIGEFGTTFADEADQVLFADLARYLQNVQADGSPVDDLHNPITSFFWFAWNANSGDTGGLVTSPDWDSIVWQKIEYLQGLGLAPWYTGAASSTVVVGGATTIPTSPEVPAVVSPAGNASVVPALTPTADNTSAPTGTAPTSVATPESTAIPTTESPAAKPTSPATVPATPAETPAPPPPATTQAPQACRVVASYTSVWQDPTYGPYMTSVSLSITNEGSEAVSVPWTLSVSSTDYTNVQYSWNWQISAGYDGSTVSGVASQDWLAIQPGQNAVNLGYVAGSNQATNFIPADVSVNGQVCVRA